MTLANISPFQAASLISGPDDTAQPTSIGIKVSPLPRKKPNGQLV